MTLISTITCPSRNAAESFAAGEPHTGIFGGSMLDGQGGSAVSYHAIPPAPALSSFITSYFQTEATVGITANHTLGLHSLFLPSNSVRLLFCYGDSPICFEDMYSKTRKRSSVIGMHCLHTPCSTGNLPATIKIFDVRFKPGGFCRLFGVSPTEIGNACYGAEEFLGSEGRAIDDRLNNSTSLSERIEILDSFFLSRMKKNEIGTSFNLRNGGSIKTGEALRVIARLNGKVRVGQLAHMLNVPRRTLEWQFLHYTGLPAREFARNVRFRNLLSDIRCRVRHNWAEIAASHGYYDQAHMIKDFKAATTLTPESFVQLEGKIFFRSVGVLNFIDPTREHPAFVSQWIEASARMEEYFKAFSRFHNSY